MLSAACAPKYPTVMPDEFEQAIAEPDVQLVDGHIYNDKRPHMSIAYQTPSQAHEQSGPQQRRWKGYQSTLSTNLG